MFITQLKAYSLQSRLIFALIANILYATLFTLLYPTVGNPLGAISLLLVVVTGWLLGRRLGALAGFFTGLLNFGLYGFLSPTETLVQNILPFLVSIFIGGLVGWLSDLVWQTRIQTQELARQRQVLTEHIAHRERTETTLRHLSDDNLQTTTQLAQRIEELATINRITQTITSKLDFQAMLATVNEELTMLFKADTCGIALLDATGTHLTVVAEHRQQGQADAVGLALPLTENPLSAKVIQTGQPDTLPIPKIAANTEQGQVILQNREAQCLMVLPLIARGDVFGTIGLVDTTHPGRVFTQLELQLAQTIAGQIAGVIENARLFDNEQHQRQIAESLSEVSFALNSSLDQDKILSAIFDQLDNVIDYDSTGLMLQVDRALVVCAGRNLSETLLGKRLPLDGHNLALEPFRQKKAIVISDVHQDPRWQIWPDGEQIRGWMAAPLLIHDQAIGLLTLDSYAVDVYAEKDAQILQTFANQAAIAIRNAQLYEAAQLEIAERKQIEASLAQARDQALEASRLKSQLLARVSHELRTPLSAILVSKQLTSCFFGKKSTA